MGPLKIISRYLAVFAVIILAIAIVTSQVEIIIIALVCLVILLSILSLWRSISCKDRGDPRICREPTIKLPEKIAIVCAIVGIISFFLMNENQVWAYPFMVALFGVILTYVYNAINTFEAGGLFFSGISVAGIAAPVICFLFVIGFHPLFGQTYIEMGAAIGIITAVIWIVLFATVKIKQSIRKFVLKPRDPRRPYDFNISFLFIGMVVISVGVLILGNVAIWTFFPDMGEHQMQQVNLNVPEVPRLFPLYEDHTAHISHFNFSPASPNATVLGTSESMDQFCIMVNESGDQLTSLFTDSVNLVGLGGTDDVQNMTNILHNKPDISK